MALLHDVSCVQAVPQKWHVRVGCSVISTHCSHTLNALHGLEGSGVGLGVGFGVGGDGVGRGVGLAVAAGGVGAGVGVGIGDGAPVGCTCGVGGAPGKVGAGGNAISGVKHTPRMQYEPDGQVPQLQNSSDGGQYNEPRNAESPGIVTSPPARGQRMTSFSTAIIN